MHAPKIKLRPHTYQDTTEIKIQVIHEISNVRIRLCNLGLDCQSHLPQGCTLLLHDKTMAIDEFIK